MDHLGQFIIEVAKTIFAGSKPKESEAVQPQALKLPKPIPRELIEPAGKKKRERRSNPKAKRLRTEKKTGETKCRAILERLTGFKWPSVRPLFLKTESGKCLELDMFCWEMSIAFEYDGIQHFKYQPFFHASYSDFEKAQENDRMKEALCRQHNIKLVRIPCYEFEKLDQSDPKELDNYLLRKLSDVLPK
jgi:hypothetical protein